MFALQMKTKSQFQFWTIINLFKKYINFAMSDFIHQWMDITSIIFGGLKPYATLSFSGHFTINRLEKARYEPFDITNPEIQKFLNET
jgi:hypothetical protein